MFDRFLRLAGVAPLLAALVLAACKPVTLEGASNMAAAPEAGHGAAEHGAAHWSYSGDTGPAYWGELSPEFAACATGTEQSPINIDTVAEENLANLQFHYKPSNVNIVNNGHTVEVVYDPGSYFTLDGVQYDLVQFHFHSPSEHTVDGQFGAIELHLVHSSVDGQKAVVGVLIQEGAANPAFQPVWEHLPANAGEEETFDAQVDAATLLPSDQTTFRYDGSLTTPPCTEGINWFLMTNMVELSAEQIAAFTAIYDGNNRPVEPLDGRTIVVDTTP